jgi:hypothetical protein
MRSASDGLVLRGGAPAAPVDPLPAPPPPPPSLSLEFESLIDGGRDGLAGAVEWPPGSELVVATDNGAANELEADDLVRNPSWMQLLEAGGLDRMLLRFDPLFSVLFCDDNGCSAAGIDVSDAKVDRPAAEAACWRSC